MITLVFATSLLAACSKKDDSNAAKDSNGACTDATINAYNNINAKARVTLYSSSRADLVETQNACVSFKALVGANTCKAMITNLNDATSTETVVSSTSKDTICNSIDQKIKLMDLLQQDGTPTVQIRPRPTAPDVVSIEDSKKVLALNAKLEVTLIIPTNNTAANSDLYVFQGGISSLLQSMAFDSSKPYCMIIKTGTQLQAANSRAVLDQIKLTADRTQITLSAMNENGFVQISCSPSTGQLAEDLSLNEIKKAFGAYMKFVVLR